VGKSFVILIIGLLVMYLAVTGRATSMWSALTASASK
jgi:hypothetical protein